MNNCEQNIQGKQLEISCVEETIELQCAKSYVHLYYRDYRGHTTYGLTNYNA